MYKITVLFESDHDGIYTQEIETADNEYWKNIKYARLLDRWMQILGHNIGTGANSNDENDLDNQYIIDSINLKLSYDNKRHKTDRDRKFNIKVEKFG
jgi:hypothetical protein